MKTVTATLVSQSKDGRRAMVIVRGKTDGKSHSVTRHVEREGRNSPFVGANPDPNTPTARETAARRVRYANERLAYTKATLASLQGPNNPYTKNVDPRLINAAEALVREAEVILKVAQANLTEVEANFPLKVQFQF